MSDTVNRLPVFDTVGESLKYTFRNFDLMIQLIWVWAILIALVSVAAHLTGGDHALRQFYLGIDRPNEVFGAYDLFLYIALLLLSLAATYSIIVGWHRALLLDERPQPTHAKIGKREIHYFLRTLGLSLLAIIPAAALMAVVTLIFHVMADRSGGLIALTVVAVFACGLLLMAFIMRFILIFPGAAVGDRRITFRSSFQMTRKNGLKIFAGFLLIGLFQLMILVPVFVILVLALFGGFDEMATAFRLVASGGDVGWPFIVLGAMNYLLSMLFLFFSLSYMSYCYWFLVPPPGEDDLAA